MKAVADASGVPFGTINSYLGGAEMKIGNAAALADATGVRLDWLATGRGPMRDEPAGERNPPMWSEGTVLIPRYDARASTGPGGDIDASPIVEQVPFPEHFIRRVLNRNPADLALVDIGGDSMVPTLFDGDRALVDTSVRDIGAGKIYMLAIGNALLAKRLQRRLDGSVLVISDNTRYPAETVSPSEATPLHIFGQVIWRSGTVNQ